MNEVLNYTKFLRNINIILLVIYSVALGILTIAFIIGLMLSAFFAFVDWFSSFYGEEVGLSGVIMSDFFRLIVITIVLLVLLFIPSIVFIVSSGKFIKTINGSVNSDKKQEPQMLHQTFNELCSHAKNTVYLQVIGYVIYIVLIIVKIVNTILNESNDEMFFLFYFSALGLVIISGIIFSLVFPLIKLLNLSKNKELMLESLNNNSKNHSVWKY